MLHALPTGAHGSQGPGPPEGVGPKSAGRGGSPLPQPDLSDRGWPGSLRVYPDRQASVQAPAPRWAAERSGGGLATAWSCYMSLSFLPVLINVFTVTPDLRPISEKVRFASKPYARNIPWPGPPLATGRPPLFSYNFYLQFWFLPGAPFLLGGPGGSLCDRRRQGR